MPQREAGNVPLRLSQTGAFRDLGRLEPSEGLVPYDLNVSFWSDGASKRRWISVPRNSKGIHFSATGEFVFPAGTVFVKHFELAGRRLETRLVVRDVGGGVYGASYRWRPDNSDADLVSDARTERVGAGSHTQNWTYPGRGDCRTCHTAVAGGVLGPKARQLNREFRYPDGAARNELVEWSRLGLFENPPDARELANLPTLSAASDTSRPLQSRVRSWLDANCAQCHRPGGVSGYFDARFDTPLARQNLIDGPVLINLGLDHARLVARHDPWRSVLLARITMLDQPKMPPLAHNVVDQEAAELLRQWIDSLPGPPVLAPPVFEPKGIDSKQPIDVTIRSSERGAVIRYTLDGSVPRKSSPLYERPLKIDSPVTIRAAAFKDGFKTSITSQETYVIGE